MSHNQRLGSPAFPSRFKPFPSVPLLSSSLALLFFSLLSLLLLTACQAQPTYNATCVTPQDYVVNGGSLAGLLEPGTHVTALMGYQTCNPVERGDLVLYRYAGDASPLIKIVQAVPDDRFALVPNNGSYRLEINNQTATNAQGIPYRFSGQAYQMLHLYETSYDNVIPADAYLLLGNEPAGTLDSTRFGLGDKKDLLGVVPR